MDPPRGDLQTTAEAGSQQIRLSQHLSQTASQISPVSPNEANDQFHDADDGFQSQAEATPLLASPGIAQESPVVKTADNFSPSEPARTKKSKPGCLAILISLCSGKRRCEKRVSDAATSKKAADTCQDKPEKSTFFSKVARPVKAQKKNRAVFPETFKFKIVVLGIDNSGKSAFISRVMRSPAEHLQTTWGFARSNVDGPNGEVITLYDLGGHSRIRGIWVNYIAEVHAALFVVDAADLDRLPEAKQALHDIYGDQRLFGKPLIIVANKQDDPNALSLAEISRKLDVTNLKRLYPDLRASRQDLERAASAPHEPIGEKSREELLRDMVNVVGCKSLLHIENHSTYIPDPSVDNVINEALVRIKANLRTLQPRIEQAVNLEEERFKREREEQLKRVEEFRKQRKDEKDAILIAETVAYPQAPMP